MGNFRSICWLLLGIALTVGAHFLLDMRTGAARIVPRMSLSGMSGDATRLKISRDGVQTIIDKSSGAWQIVEPFSASADKIAVMKLLDAVSFSPIVDFMDDAELSRLARRRSDFGLEVPRVTIEIAGPKGEEKLGFGETTPSGDGVYVEIAGENAVFVVDANVFAAVNLSADNLRSRALFTIGADEVGAFDVRRNAGAFMRFARDGEKWRMKEPHDSPASSVKVRKFLSEVLDARVSGFVWPVGASNETEAVSVSLLAGYGLDPENAVTLTIKAADGTDRLLSLGKEAGKGFVYALAHNGGAVVTVESSFKDLVLEGIDGFMDVRLFPYEEASVASISIADGDSQFLLAKNADGSWRMDAPVAAPADYDEVSSLLSRLLAAHYSAADASGMPVSLSTNSKPVLVSREIVLGGHRLDDLRSKDVVKIDPGEVRRVVSTPSGGKPVAVVYDAVRRAWNVELSPNGGVANITAVESLLESLKPLRAEKVVTLKVGPGDLARYGLDEPTHIVAVDFVREDSVRRNILIGDKAPGGRYITIGSSDAVFVLGEIDVKRLMAPLVGD